MVMTKEEQRNQTILYLNKANAIDIVEIQELVKTRREQISKQKMSEFVVGDKVWFTHNNEKVTGTIRKKNIKRLVVDTKQGGWNIPASMLTLVEEWDE